MKTSPYTTDGLLRTGGENSLRGFGEELATCCLGVAGNQIADLSARLG
ncbi:MAG: hypothetical protein GY800_06430 [Planctomycetes bacterium]|nr:hypothetical protein [Planctomycetota bacterium]